MTRSLLGSALLLATAVLCGACVSEQDTAYANTAVADDGASVLILVVRGRSRTTGIVYENTVWVGGLTSKLWLIPPEGSGAPPRLIRDFGTVSGPRFDELFGMLAAGYLYLNTFDEGRSLLDLVSGESRLITAAGEAPNDLYLPSRDGKLLAHVLRESETHCEYSSLGDCATTVEFLDTTTLARVSLVAINLPYSEPLVANTSLSNRIAWTADGTLRFTYGRTIDIGVDGAIRDVPYEPCYYAPTSSGLVSLAGEHFKQAVNAEGEFTSLSSSNIFDPLDPPLFFGCVLPAE
jgi:hypothetical protein